MIQKYMITLMAALICQQSLATTQTEVNFQDEDVPQFWVVEKNGQQKVIIDNAPIKTKFDICAQQVQKTSKMGTYENK